MSKTMKHFNSSSTVGFSTRESKTLKSKVINLDFNYNDVYSPANTERSSRNNQDNSRISYGKSISTNVNSLDLLDSNWVTNTTYNIKQKYNLYNNIEFMIFWMKFRPVFLQELIQD